MELKKQKFILFGLTVFVIFMIAVFNNPIIEKQKKGNTENGGIDALMAKLGDLKKQPAYEDIIAPAKKVQDFYNAKALMNKTDEELRAELLSEVQQQDRKDFKKELKTIFDVGDHENFFKRQIDNCRHKIDLAVVGMGIIRIHEVLKGENLTVRKTDEKEFILYVKDQVQQAIAAQDKNYKTIVFKGLESSIN